MSRSPSAILEPSEAATAERDTAAPADAAVEHPSPKADTLAASVVILVAMSVVQRMVGFGRSVLFCRWLEPEELGRWDMAMGFLATAAPLLVLGIPGSFGRYVEHYRRRGLLPWFLRRAVLLSAAGCAVGIAAVAAAAPWFSRLVFGTAARGNLVLLLALVLAGVIAFNFVAELFTALRLYRVNSVLQFATSLSFAAVSLALILFWRSDVTSIVVGFGVANLVVFLGGLVLVSKRFRGFWNSPESRQSLDSPGTDLAGRERRSVWTRVMPFALGVWVVNWLSNTFEVIDRYMIIHFGGMTAEDALAMVGNYHSARIVPLLLVSLAGLFGGMLMPHLSKDWESGRREEVGRRLNLSLKLLCFALVGCGSVVLVASPLLFGVAFDGKYDGGLPVLPLTLTYCTWLGLAYVAEKYLWCAEKTRLAGVAFLAGLICNVWLNLLLLPRYGLAGAVTATAAANLAALWLVLGLSRWLGMRVDPALWPATLLPLSLCLGPWVTLAVLTGVGAAAVCGNRLLNEWEKRELTNGVFRRR